MLELTHARGFNPEWLTIMSDKKGIADKGHINKAMKIFVNPNFQYFFAKKTQTKNNKHSHKYPSW